MAGQEFFTLGTLGTLAGATTIIIVVTNTARSVIGLRSPLVPFLISLLVTFGAAAAAETLSAWPSWVLAFFNSCLLFCTATGAQTTLVEGAKGKLGGEMTTQSGQPKPRWLSDWLRN